MSQVVKMVLANADISSTTTLFGTGTLSISFVKSPANIPTALTSRPRPSAPRPDMVQSSCLCGKNRIQIDAEPSLQFICHCTDERKLTGAAFAFNIMYPAATLKVLSGKLATFTKIADSGNKMTNHSCDECGGLLYRSSSGFPEHVVLKAGLIDGFDAAREFKPVAEVFTRSRLPWLRPLEGVKQESGDFGSTAEAEAAR